MFVKRYLTAFNEIVELSITDLFLWSIISASSLLLVLNLELQEIAIHNASILPFKCKLIQTFISNCSLYFHSRKMMRIKSSF